jgi:hypothetical protein
MVSSNCLPVQCRPNCIHKEYCILCVLSLRSSLTRRRKLKEIFLSQLTYWLDVVLEQHRANVVEDWLDIRQESKWIWLVTGSSNHYGSIKSTTKMLVAVAVMSESAPQKYKLAVKAVLITQSSGHVHQCWKYSMLVGWVKDRVVPVLD